MILLQRMAVCLLFFFFDGYLFRVFLAWLKDRGEEGRAIKRVGGHRGKLALKIRYSHKNDRKENKKVSK